MTVTQLRQSDLDKKSKDSDMTQNNAEKQKALDAALSQIERAFGKGSIMKMNDKQKIEVDTISTGSLGLDIGLGIGGLPRGRVVEIYGPESSGKTTMALHVIAEAQKQGGTCAMADAEHALDPCYAKKLGVDIDNLLIADGSLFVTWGSFNPALTIMAVGYWVAGYIKKEWKGTRFKSS